MSVIDIIQQWKMIANDNLPGIVKGSLSKK